MFEGLFQPMHLLIVALITVATLLTPVCVLWILLRLFRIDKSLKAILAELQLQRKGSSTQL